jgi:hypothetical protein
MPEPKSKEKYVRYIGTAGTRIIDTDGWLNVGVKDQPEMVWSVRNGWKIPQADFSDNALQYFEQDEGFVVDK